MKKLPSIHSNVEYDFIHVFVRVCVYERMNACGYVAVFEPICAWWMQKRNFLWHDELFRLKFIFRDLQTGTSSGSLTHWLLQPLVKIIFLWISQLLVSRELGKCPLCVSELCRRVELIYGGSANAGAVYGLLHTFRTISTRNDASIKWRVLVQEPPITIFIVENCEPERRCEWGSETPRTARKWQRKRLRNENEI